jgi:hypothetical protein
MLRDDEAISEREFVGFVELPEFVGLLELVEIGETRRD